MEDSKSKEKTSLRRERGVFVLDVMAKTGVVKFSDNAGNLKMVSITKKDESGFARPAR